MKGTGWRSVAVGLLETSGPTALYCGPIVDGEYLKRSGETLISGAGGGGVTDHGALTGLLDDDHTQYALAGASRAGTISVEAGSAINQDVTTDASPTFATVKLTSLTDGFVPYHVSDAAGLANSPLWTNGVNARCFPETGGTYNANFLFNYNDTFPTIYFRSGTTQVGYWQFNANTGDMFIAAYGVVDSSRMEFYAENTIRYYDYNGGSPSARVTIDLINGRLGVGVTPTVTLDIAGAGKFTGQVTSTLAVGTSPFAITSTTVNTNLNADLWDGYQFSDYLDQAVKQASSPTFATVKLTTLTNGYLPYHVSDASGLADSPLFINTAKVLLGTVNLPSNKNTVVPTLLIAGNSILAATQVIRHTTVGGGGGLFMLSATRGSDANSYTVLQNGDGIGTLVFSGADGDEFVAAALITASVDGTPGDNNMPGRITFCTAPDGSPTILERMRIDNAGQVGIGCTPSYLLQVNTDSAAKPGIGGLWTVPSDARIKKDIALADLDRCYDIVKSVPLKYFGWADGIYTDKQVSDQHGLGWIAQDVQPYFPKAVGVKPFIKAKKISAGTEEYLDESTGVMTKREKLLDDVIVDCLDLNSGQLIAAMYGAVQKLMERVEKLGG